MTEQEKFYKSMNEILTSIIIGVLAIPVLFILMATGYVLAYFLF